MTVAHLLLLLIPTSALTFLLAWLQSVIGVRLSFEARYWASFPLAFVASIFVAWPLARVFRVPPLMIFSGPCPAFQRSPPAVLAGGCPRPRQARVGVWTVWRVNRPLVDERGGLEANFKHRAQLRLEIA